MGETTIQLGNCTAVALYFALTFTRLGCTHWVRWELHPGLNTNTQEAYRTYVVSL